MKTRIFIAILAAFCLSGCQKDMGEIEQPGSSTGTKVIKVTFTTGQEGITKTAIEKTDDGYRSVWTSGDALGVYVDTGDPETTTDNAKFTVTSIDPVTGAGTFTGYIKVPETGDIACNIYYYYPYYVKAGQSDNLKLAIPTEQIPSEKMIDPKANIMLGKPLSGTLSASGITSDDLEIMFIHKTTFLQMKVASCTATGVNPATEKVRYVKFERANNRVLAGEGAWLNARTSYPNNTNFSPSGMKNSKSVLLSILESEQVALNQFEGWFTCANFTAEGSSFMFPVEDTFYITIVTDAHTIRKTWIPVKKEENKTVYFNAGAVNIVNLNITDSDEISSSTEKPVDKFAEVTELSEDMSGEYFIAGTPDNGTTWYIAENKDAKGIIMVPTNLIFDKALVYDGNSALINNKVIVTKVPTQEYYTLRYYNDSMSASTLLAAKANVDGNKSYGFNFSYSEDATNKTTYWTFARDNGNWVIENQAVGSDYAGGKYIRFYKEDDKTYYLYGYESQSSTDPYFDIHLFKKIN